MLQGKRIILGITGSIAAYKCIMLVRLLTKQGAEVRVVMSKAAQDFVSPLVLSTFSGHPVWMEFHENNVWNNHVELGLWGDVMLIAPATCHTLGKMANGLCDNLVLATFLSARCPVVVAPAMDEDMFLHPATQASMAMLRSRGTLVLDVNTGSLASGLHGPGRMAEPEEMIQALCSQVFRKQDFAGKKVLISAGPTQESIDPVRFISNHSSGKMGIAIAEAMYLLGADVTLVAGPMHVTVQYAGIRVIPVRTAAEMETVCLSEFPSADIGIMAAAVADYRPVQIADEKIKKQAESWSISLAKTSDILAQMGEMKHPDQVLVGFALETENEEVNAQAKLIRKKLDYIVLNSLRDPGAGFGTDTNQVTIMRADGAQMKLTLASKNDIALKLCQSLKVWQS
ncbi:bifunctional phosphopantothenoylcysteine decarboxylase/phosphopantothenate--cysteine ligase CoaBC [Aquirufa echingensis]|uniref:Coenzyme A biosynthesis bifunctional protein CoaBC n=1 Tax=Aquirufa echingensis TaxID=3096516 RepID=A0ABW6D5I4_9BACT